MRLKTLTVQNFRKFSSQSFAFNPRFNVLIGRNASGKTQLLDAVSIILSVYQSKAGQGKGAKVRGISREEVRVVESRFEDGQIRRERLFPAAVSACLEFRGETHVQTCVKNTVGGRATSGRKTTFSQIGENDYEKIVRGEAVDLPFLGYYGSGRVESFHSRIQFKNHVESRTDGYFNSLEPRNDVEALQSWLKRRALIQIQNKRTDVPLELTRQAMRVMIPDCADVDFDFQSDSVYLTFDNGAPSTPFSNLSDGFRCMTSMVTDIARRIAILNPHMGLDALQKTSGVVLIDELDLYLHPEWQRRVIDNLKSVFPLLQFIVTTHSPFIIQSAAPGELLDLEACDGQTLDVGEETSTNDDDEKSVAFPTTDQEYANRSLEDVAEDVMKIPVPQRSEKFQQMYVAAKRYYELLEKGKDASPEEKARLKDELDVLIAPFSDNVAYYAFLEMKRLAALGI